jgi:hypothetical protein
LQTSNSFATQNIVVVNEAFCDFFGQRWRNVAETSLFAWLERLDPGASRRWAEMERCVHLEGMCHGVEFRDDGPGYPADVLRLERHNVGFDLVQNIVRKSLLGELSLYNDPGAVAAIRFAVRVNDD